MEINEILQSNDKELHLGLFQFSKEDDNDVVLARYNLWARFFFSQYFEDEDALFHKDINLGNLDAYRGKIDYFVDIAFRGAGKDVKTKLFIAYSVLNDKDRLKKYFKILSEDTTNSKQIVTDIYNMLVNPKVIAYYPNTFGKSVFKREETMSSFTTGTGIKVIADTVGTEQRGAIQEETRPDFVWFNDFESRKTLRSAVVTRALRDNMEEARTSLQKGGCCIYTCLEKNTKFVTSDGVKSFTDFKDGSKTHVLTHTGQWKEAVVKNFGKQVLQKIKFRRGKRNNIEVWATLDHNWILRDGKRTNNLKTGDKVLGAPNIFKKFVYENSSPEERLYWAYGYVFGDGTKIKQRSKHKYSMVRLFGNDVKFKNRFEELGFITNTNQSLKGDYFAYTGSYLKTLPDPGKDSPYLIRAFVRGFLDADGAKGRKDRRYSSPFVQMVQTDKHGALRFIRECFPIAGVFITNETKIGGQMNISPDDKSKVITRHETATRFGLGSNFEDKFSNMQFTAEITEDRKVEDVWCLVVEDDHSFVLDSGISTGNCNYISEMGNVHLLVTEKQSEKKRVLSIPIMDKEGNSTWSRYTKNDIRQMQQDDDDFNGERMCKPDSSKDVYFDREILDKMEIRQPIKEIAGFKIYRNYDPSHRYAGGHDIAGGVGLDSSTSAFIDFSTIPAQVVGSFASNTVLPEAFGDEIYSEANNFGGCLVAPENNKFDQTILKAKQLGANIYKSRKGQTLKTIAIHSPYQWGWNTNSLTKSKMMSDFRKACNDGLIALNDKDIIQEAKSYTRNDLIDNSPDPRDVPNATRHFDLLTAVAIAWQMKDFCEPKGIDAPISYQEEVTYNPSE